MMNICTRIQCTERDDYLQQNKSDIDNVPENVETVTERRLLQRQNNSFQIRYGKKSQTAELYNNEYIYLFYF